MAARRRRRPPEFVVHQMPSDYSFEGFCCRADGKPDELSNYVVQGDAHSDQIRGFSRTYVVETEDGDLIGYFSLLADAIRLRPDEQVPGVAYRSAPAVKIARLAVSAEMQGMGIGEKLLDYIRAAAMGIGETIGVRYLTLDSVPDKIEWYHKRGFVQNIEDQPSSESDEGSGELSMRYDLGAITGRPSFDIVAPHAPVKQRQRRSGRPLTSNPKPNKARRHR